MPALMYRFDHVSDEIAEKALDVIKGCERYLVCREDPDGKSENVHYHCYVLGARAKAKWNTGMNVIGLKGNAMHSCKEWDDSKAGLDYICKGDGPDSVPEIVLNNYLSDEEIAKCHARWWEVHAQIQEVNEKKRKRPTWSSEVIDELYEKYRQKQPGLKRHDADYTEVYNSVIRDIVGKFLRARKPYVVRISYEMAQTVMGLLFEHHRKDMEDQVRRYLPPGLN